MKQTLMGGSGTPAYPPQYPAPPPAPSWTPGSTQPEASDTTPDGGPHGTDPAPDTSPSGYSPTQAGGTPRRAGKSPFASTVAFESPFEDPPPTPQTGTQAFGAVEAPPATPRGMGGAPAVAPPRKAGGARFGSTMAFEADPGAKEALDRAVATPAAAPPPASPMRPPSGPGSQPGPQPHGYALPANPDERRGMGAPRRAGKSHLSSTVAFEVDVEALQKEVDNAAGRAQAAASPPAVDEEERPPDTKSFPRVGEQARGVPAPAPALSDGMGPKGPVRAGKSHLVQTVAFLPPDEAQAMKHEIDQAAERAARAPATPSVPRVGPPAMPPPPLARPLAPPLAPPLTPPLPPAAPPLTPAAPWAPPPQQPGVSRAAVIDVATGEQKPTAEHWHAPPAAQSKEAALKMKLLTSRKRTMIGGVKLLDVLAEEHAAGEAQREQPMQPPAGPAAPQVGLPAAPQVGPPAAPFAGPPAFPGAPPPTGSQPRLAPNPAMLGRRGTVHGIGPQDFGMVPPGAPPGMPVAPMGAPPVPQMPPHVMQPTVAQPMMQPMMGGQEPQPNPYAASLNEPSGVGPAPAPPSYDHRGAYPQFADHTPMQGYPPVSAPLSRTKPKSRGLFITLLVIGVVVIVAAAWAVVFFYVL